MVPPPIPATTIQYNSMPLPLEALYSSREALFEAIQAWARPYRYAFTIRRSKKREGSGRIKVFYICDRRNIVSYSIGYIFLVIAYKLPDYKG